MWHTVISSLPELITAGLKFTIPLAIISFAVGLVLAVITALIRISKPKGNQLTKGIMGFLKAVAYFYVWLFRSTPLLVQLFIIFFGLPSVGIEIPAFTAAIVTFSLNTGAYASENIRGALLSIPKDQWEAAMTLGFNNRQALTKIIFPQAFRIALPTLSNEFIGLVKDTSLASSITILEMFTVSQQITAKNYQPMLMYCTVAALYAIVCTILSIGQHYLEKWANKYVTKGGSFWLNLSI